MQPLFIDFRGKKVVIVGGGSVAAQKARALQEEQAEIVFIAPIFSAEVLVLSREKGHTLICREAKPSDFTNAMLVILATNNRKINEELAKHIPSNQLVCVVDEFKDGNTVFPATIRRGLLQIAVTSTGASPKLTRKLKLHLETQFDRSWEDYTTFLYQCREIIKNLSVSQKEKNELLSELLGKQYRVDKKVQADTLLQLKQRIKSG